MSRPGLVVVNSSRSWGGNEHWALRVAQGMAERGHPVRFIWSHPAVGDRVAAAGLKGRRIRMRGDADLPGLLCLAGQIRQVRARAVLATRDREYLLAGLAARLAGRPRTIMGLGLRVAPRPDLKRRLMFSLADRILVNAPEIRTGLAALPWIDADRIDVVVNGVDLDNWPPRWLPGRADAGLAQRRAWGLSDTAPLVVTVGNLSPQKDHVTLMAAAQKLRETMPDLRVMILGEGPQRGQLEQELAARNLAGTVTLAGFCEDVAPALAAADLFVLSSNNEGMAWVLMEAAASGLPIVTTDVSGARWCVEDGVSGRVVPVGDAGSLAAAAGGLLSDRELSQAMGRRARGLAEERFTVTRMLDETEAVLFGDPSYQRQRVSST